MSLQVGTLVQVLSVDPSQWRRGMAQARASANQLWRDQDGRLRDARGRFARAGEDAGSGFAGGLSRGLRLVGAGLLLTAAKLALVASAAAFATGAVLKLVAALVAMSGLLLAIPAAVVALYTVVGTLKLGLQGVADAIKGDNEALAKLAPTARAAVKEIRSLSGAWDQIRRDVQQNLFAGLATDIRDLASVWLPVLRNHLGATAVGLNIVAREIASAATDPGFVTGISAAFVSLIRILHNAKGAIGNLVLGLGGLVGAGAPIIERLGNGLVGLIGQFGAWLKQAGESGRLTEILENALATAKQFGAVLVQVGGIFGAIFNAMPEGGGILGALATALQSVNTVLSSMEGQSALSGLFGSLGQIGSIIATIIAQLGPGLSALLSNLMVGLQALAPAAAPVGQALSALATAVAPLLAALGPVLAVAFQQLATAVSAVALALGPSIALFAQLVGGIFARLLPLVQQIAATALPLLADAGVQVATAFAPLIPILLKVVEQFIAQLLPELPRLAQMLVDEVVPAVVDLAKMLSNGLMTALTKLMPHIPTLVGLLVTVVTVIIKVIGVGAALVSLFAAIWGKVFQLSAGLAGLSGMLLQVAAKIIGVFAAAGSWLFDAGKRIIQGLINGINSALGGLKNMLSRVTGMIPDWKGPAEVDRRLLRPSGRMLMQGLMSGIGSQVPALRMQLAGVTGRIGGALAPTAAASPAPSGTAGGDGGRTLIQVLIGGKVVEDASLRVIDGNPERVALANRKGQKRLAYAG